MKQVHAPDMVAHLWANRSQDSARTAGKNFWFTGAALFSYRESFMVAGHLDDGRILWNDETYSQTTSRHQLHARRALRGDQWTRAVHVPALGYMGFRELERLRADGDGRTVPQLAKDCAGRVVDIVQSMATMRESAGRIVAAYAEARRYQESGLALCQYVAKGKRSPRWPLPMLSEEMPRGDALKAMIRAVAKGRMMDSHARQCDESAALLAELRDSVAAGEDCAGWTIQNFRGRIGTIAGKLDNAAVQYKAATGKASGRVTLLRRELSTIEPAALAMVAAWEEKQARAELRMLAHDAFLFMRRRDTDTGRGPYGRWSAGYIKSKMGAAVRALPESEQAAWAPLLARVSRVDSWDIARQHLTTARDAMATAESYEPRHPRDALRFYSSAVSALAEIWHDAPSARMAEAWARVHGAEARDIVARGTARRDALRAEMQAREARIVDEWKAGGPHRPSFDAGTFARIRGDNVETSRGAVVPLAHACRLARIARRVISAGGRSWADGSGPMVGGFRVRSIAADGATVIGCHEFDAAEALRMLALLESCEHCASVAAEDSTAG